MRLIINGEAQTIAAAVNVFVIDAMRNMAAGVFGTSSSAFAIP